MPKQITKTYQVLTNLNCNLDCSYCYEKKDNTVQNIQDVKDSFTFLKQQDKNIKGMRTIELIGGESLLYPVLVDQIIEAAKKTWTCCTFSLSTNGTLLGKKQVRKLIQKHQPYLSVGISLDGPKNIHDAFRTYKNGSGSYNDILQNLDWYFKTVRHTGVKATFTKKTLNTYAQSIIHLIELGFDKIAGNLVYEDTCDANTAVLVAKQFEKIINHLFENKLEKTIDFSQLGNINPDAHKFHIPSANLEKTNYCGSCVYMTCLGFDRFLYGCNRFCTMQKPGMHIGQLVHGVYIPNPHFPFEAVKKQYELLPEECKNCRIQFMCPSCVAAPYETHDIQAYLNEKRMCGWTAALAGARLLLAQKFQAKKPQSTPLAQIRATKDIVKPDFIYRKLKRPGIDQTL